MFRTVVVLSIKFPSVGMPIRAMGPRDSGAETIQ